MEALPSPLLASILWLAHRQLHGRISVGSEQTLFLLLRRHNARLAFLDDLRTFSSVWVWATHLHVDAVWLVAMPTLRKGLLRVGPPILRTRRGIEPVREEMQKLRASQMAV